MTQPESFTLDHRIVDAPYIRIAEERPIRSGEVVTKFDIRFTQPNIKHLDMPAIHSIEHMLAEFLRDHSEDVIDISPMGCQTGFYILIDGPFSTGEMAELLNKACNDILTATDVPAANEVQCGWAASHSLKEAQAAVRQFLGGRGAWDQVFAK